MKTTQNRKQTTIGRAVANIGKLKPNVQQALWALYEKTQTQKRVTIDAIQRLGVHTHDIDERTWWKAVNYLRLANYLPTTDDAKGHTTRAWTRTTAGGNALTPADFGLTALTATQPNATTTATMATVTTFPTTLTSRDATPQTVAA